jgi:hypothetical protein
MAFSRRHYGIGTTYTGIPDGFTKGSASLGEMQEAGFHRDMSSERKPGTAPIAELLVPGRLKLTPEAAETVFAEAQYIVLRDPQNAIVATWDEGRWWTAEESAAFVAAIVAEMGDPEMGGPA